MNFTIYSIGDFEFLEQVLIAIAMLGGVGDFAQMTKIGLGIGVLATMLSAIAKGGRNRDPACTDRVPALATMFIPTARVQVEDTYTGDIRVVDNVPIGPAAAGGIISAIGFKLTRLFEVAYSPIIPKVTQTEFAESLRILNDIRYKAINDSVWTAMNQDAGGGFVNLHKSWSAYVKDCTFKKIDLGMASPEELSKMPFRDAIRFQSQLFGTQVFTTPADPEGTNLNCTEAFAELDAKTVMGPETTAEFTTLLGFDSNNLPAGQTSQTKTQSALDALLGSAITAQTYMEVAVLEPIMLQAATKKYGQIHDMAGAIMVNQAIQQRNTTWAAEQTLFMTVIRPMLAFFEAFIYAITPIMAFVIVLGSKGVQLAGKYFMLLIWVQLWMPILSVINLYMYTSAARKMDTLAAMGSHNWDSFYALSATANTAEHWIATGGVLAASTPALSLMLIYGSAVTATHLAGWSDSTIDPTIGGTPDLMKSSPMLSSRTGFDGNETTGAIKQGAEKSDVQVSAGQEMSNVAASYSSQANRSMASFKEGLQSSVQNADGQTYNWEKVSALGSATSTMSGAERASQQSYVRAAEESYGQDFSNDSRITGLATLAASGGISPGEFAKGVNARVNGNYSAQDNDTNSQAVSRDKLTKAAEGLNQTDGDRTAFTSQLASRLDESTRTGGNTQWANSSTVSSAKDYATSSEKAEQYTAQAARMQKMGVNSSQGLNEIAGKVGNSQPAFDNVKSTFNALALSNPGLGAIQQQSYQNTEGRFGNDQQRLAHSMMNAMLHESAYTQPGGHREGMESILGAMQATTHGMDLNAPLPGDEARNSSVGNVAPMSNRDNPYGSVEAAPTVTDRSDIYQPQSQTGGINPSNAASHVSATHAWQQSTVSAKNDENLAQFEQGSLSTSSGYQSRQTEALIKDFNQDVANGDLYDNAALTHVEGAADNAGDFAKTQAAAAIGGIQSFAQGMSAQSSQEMANIANFSPEDLSSRNAAFEQRYAGNEGFASLISGAQQAGTSTIGFMQQLATGGSKPEGMTYGAFAEANRAAYGMVIAAGGEAFAQYADQLYDNAYQAKLGEAESAGLQGHAATMYAESFALKPSDIAEAMGSLYDSAMAPVEPVVAAASIIGDGGELSQSQKFTGALNGLKMEFVPQNVDSNGYEYQMVNGRQEYSRNENGEHIQHFSWGTNDYGQPQIVLANEQHEDYTNNLASTVKDASTFGRHSDTHGGMIRAGQVEQLRRQSGNGKRGVSE